MELNVYKECVRCHSSVGITTDFFSRVHKTQLGGVFLGSIYSSVVECLPISAGALGSTLDTAAKKDGPGAAAEKTKVLELSPVQNESC